MALLGKVMKAVSASTKAAPAAAQTAGRALKGPPAGRTHLIAKKVDVTRGGRTFQSTRYVKPDAKGATKAVAAAGHDAPKSLKQNVMEVVKGGLALKVVKKTAGIAIGAVAAGNELARRRGDKDAPAPFSDSITKWDNARSSLAGVGIIGAVAGLTGDIMHRIPASAYGRIPKVGKALAVVAKGANHKVTHRMMMGGAALSITNFDAAGRNVARKYDEGKLHQGATSSLAGLKEHAFVLHSGLPDWMRKGEHNPFKNVKGYTPQVGDHGPDLSHGTPTKKKSDH